MIKKPKSYQQAVEKVLNHSDCIAFDILLGLHAKSNRRTIGFYGRFKLGWKIMKGDWAAGLVQFPSGQDLGVALRTVARSLDAQAEGSNDE